MRITFQPALLRARVTILSRALLRVSLFFQNLRFVLGCEECFGQQCQKQPSTNNAIFDVLKTKSGLPKTFWFLLQPVIRVSRNNFAKTISVSLFPRPRTRDITSDRFPFVNISAMETKSVYQERTGRFSCAEVSCSLICSIMFFAWMELNIGGNALPINSASEVFVISVGNL